MSATAPTGRPPPTYVLGIDIGTTFTAAVVARDGRAEPLTLGSVAPVIPSVVALREGGVLVIGEAAERRAMLQPGTAAREFKRRLGDTTPLILGGTPFAVEALMARLLRAVAEEATQREGGTPATIVVTHPATYGPYKREQLAQMARQADVGAVDFLTEPQAAAIDYAARNRLEVHEIVAVYDFGGGTFDAAIVRRADSGFQLLGQPEGIDRLGGIDFDEAVFAHVRSVVGGSVDALNSTAAENRAALARLRADVRAAKEALSTDTDTTIPVLLPGVQQSVRLTRSEFEAMIGPRIQETIDVLLRTVRSAGLTMEQVSRILLVGGSSRIPLVAEMVRQATRRPIVADAHPKLAVARGAALYGLQLLGERQIAATHPASTPVAVAEPTLPPPPTFLERVTARLRPLRPHAAMVAVIAAALVVGTVAALGGAGGTVAPASPAPQTAASTTAPSSLVGTLPPATVSATAAAASTATPIPTAPPSATPEIAPEAIAAAFCRFSSELGGPFSAANDGIASAIERNQPFEVQYQAGALSQSAQRLRLELATLAGWAPLSLFASDMRAAIDEYERALLTALNDPFNPAAAAAGQTAYERLTAVAAQIPGLVDRHPELAC